MTLPADILTPPEAADYLRDTPEHLTHLRQRRLIGFIRQGYRTVRFLRADLDLYLERNRIAPVWEKKGKR